MVDSAIVIVKGVRRGECLLIKCVSLPTVQKELAKSITLEQGKTLADAEGDVFRGLRKF